MQNNKIPDGLREEAWDFTYLAKYSFYYHDKLTRTFQFWISLVQIFCFFSIFFSMAFFTEFFEHEWLWKLTAMFSFLLSAILPLVKPEDIRDASLKLRTYYEEISYEFDNLWRYIQFEQVDENSIYETIERLNQRNLDFSNLDLKVPRFKTIAKFSEKEVMNHFKLNNEVINENP